MKIDVYGESRKGLDHKVNEDSFLIDKKRNLFAVADGVTIPFGGKDASNLAIKYLSEFFNGDLERAFEKISEKILEDKKKNPKIGATTVTAMHISKDYQLHVACVGDSEAYLIGKEIEVLFTPAMDSAIGLPSVTIDSWKHTLSPNEFVLLCTDGISNALNSDEIKEIVKTGRNMRRVVENLMNLAEEKETAYKDDKTVVVVKVS